MSMEDPEGDDALLTSFLFLVRFSFALCFVTPNKHPTLNREETMEITKIYLGDGYEMKTRMREALKEEREPLPVQSELLARIKEFPYKALVAASLSHHLSFDAAFVAMCYALRASNRFLAERYFGGCDDFGPEGNALAAREMLSGLAMKEAWSGLTPDEVAGFVTATMLDIVRFPSYGPRVIETCGMGGDRGILVNGDPRPRKTVNSSTLSALVLATLGIKTAKHGSYSNTSAVGSTNAIERFGAVVDIPSVRVQARLAEETFHYTDAHAWKTVHDLSHLEPRRETINHVVGPMTPPVASGTRLDKVIGVNEKMRPDVVAQAYEILHRKGIFQVGNVAVVSGLSEQITREQCAVHDRLREHIVLDELSPIASAVALVQKGKFVGTFVLTPSHFGATFPNVQAPFIANDETTIFQANLATLGGVEDERRLVELVAMNAALGLYLVEAMDDDRELAEQGPSPDALKACYRRCHAALTEKRVLAFTQAYVELTKNLSNL